MLDKHQARSEQNSSIFIAEGTSGNWPAKILQRMLNLGYKYITESEFIPLLSVIIVSIFYFDNSAQNLKLSIADCLLSKNLKS